jgi:hypothetical protein
MTHQELLALKKIIRSNPCLTADDLKRALRWVTAGITSARRKEKTNDKS